jgi:hypothetical protein
MADKATTPEERKLQTLVQRLFDRTRKGEIEWEPGTDPNVFAISMPSFTVSIEREPDTGDASGAVYLRIANSEGLVLQELSEFEARKLGFGELGELFVMVRKITMGLEQALDDVLQELDEISSAK